MPRLVISTKDEPAILAIPRPPSFGGLITRRKRARRSKRGGWRVGGKSK